MAEVLSKQQVASFHEMGCLLVPDVIEHHFMQAMIADLDQWIEDSRAHAAPFGETLDHRARFDVQPGHSAEKPALRRVQSPTELSDAYLNVLLRSQMIDILADLIGPNLRLHHSKVNCKLPGSETIVDWHQDFTYDPHSNDDMVVCLIYLTDVSAENGALMTVPGSHRGPLHSLWHDGGFTGTVSREVAAECAEKAVMHTGAVGSVCFMHCRVLHASGPNTTSRPRNLYIPQIAAADAIALSANHLPCIHEGLLLRGEEPNRIRSIDFDIEMPVIPETTFFDQQAQK